MVVKYNCFRKLLRLIFHGVFMLNAGIDIGGTNIKLALVETGGDDPVIAARDRFLFDQAGCNLLCQRIADSIFGMLRQIGKDVSDLGMIGLTVPGSVDQSGEILLHAYNMGYHNVPVKKVLSTHFPGVPVKMINDAKAAALAELKAGVFRGLDTALLLTIGTGLGAGLILGGKVFNGGQNRGSEIGHMPFIKGGIPCTCGLTGCIERYTSATRLAELGRDNLGDDFADAKAVKDAAEAGDARAQELLDIYIDDLATAIGGLCSVFDPQRVALGGGFSASGDILYVPLKKLVAERNFFKAKYEIVPARFRNDAGVIGAALL